MGKNRVLKRIIKTLNYLKDYGYTDEEKLEYDEVLSQNSIRIQMIEEEKRKKIF